ncbi:ribosomal RNA adenine dimethylase [Polaribacter sp. SA4-10]|uniref:class I SAM-dependent methyltransferase n=1 Tax=Polaribacter sp. SA4-10 TaxID=754397 RepID=UPI000B3C8D2C|nr:rRNA adenine N-6-methyltransferase family protein [Polaribacter sp. SA4-10]ARV06600.1 ribosomal RNA adenine dimethylase [Polaribacter sp. SA4-10]
MTSRIKFFKEAVKNLKTLGTVTPSSRFLANRMLKEIDFSKVEVLVELGPGSGAITKHILNNLPPNATLICFEINETFYSQLLEIKHTQLIVIKSSAEKIEEELNKLGFSKTCHIISSLPLTIIPEVVSSEILDKSFQVLENGGTYIQFQYSLTYFKKLKTVFNKSISLDFEPLNLPPAFVYRCKKVV